MSPFVTSLLAGMNVAFYRLVGHRIRIAGLSVLLLTTIGAKSGKRRQTPLGYLGDERGGWLVIASAGGAARNPAWYANLVKNPRSVWIELGGRTIAVHARPLRDDERAAAWRRVLAQAPAYGRYEKRTQREIPIVLLTPA